MAGLDFSLERTFPGPVAGIDEAGRGPWAGPVVAAAVILDGNCIPEGINDSKKLSASRRATAFDCLMDTAQVGVGIATVEEIDTLNILKATMLAMQRAFTELKITPCVALVDGNRAPKLPCPCETMVSGDAHCLSIAAASIIAKVTRDRMMTELARHYPHYGWERNAGYGTRSHQDALAQHGVTPHHRRSFAPIRLLLEGKTRTQEIA